jgi:hypothetical protein
MKTIIIILLGTFIFSHASAQDKQETIKSIEKKQKAIDLETGYQIVTLENGEFLDSGFIKQPSIGYGTLTGYFKNGKLYKISEQIGIRLLYQHAATDYYFSDEKLILVYENEVNTRPVFFDSIGIVDNKSPGYTFDCYYYFDDEKLIGSEPKGQRQTMLLPDEKYFDSQSKEGQLLTSANEYVTLLKKKHIDR